MQVLILIVQIYFLASVWSTEYKIVGSSLPRTTSARPLTNCLLEIGCLLATQLA